MRQCCVCKQVFEERSEVYACVARGNPNLMIPWVCNECHKDCYYIHCFKI